MTKDELNVKHRFSNASVKKPLEDMTKEEMNLTLNEYINISADHEKIKFKAQELQKIKDDSTSSNSFQQSTFLNQKRSALKSNVEPNLKKPKLFSSMCDEEKIDFYEERVASQESHEINMNFLKEVESLGDDLTFDVLDGMLDFSASVDFTPIQFVRLELTKEIKKVQGQTLKIKFIKNQLPSNYFNSLDNLKK